MFSTCLQLFVSRNQHLGPESLHPQKHIHYHLPKKKKVTFKKKKLQIVIKFSIHKNIYSETWLNFLHLIFFTQRNIFCVSISKNTIKFRDAWFFNFLLHLTCQKWPSLACTHPFDSTLCYVWASMKEFMTFFIIIYGQYENISINFKIVLRRYWSMWCS